MGKDNSIFSNNLPTLRLTVLLGATALLEAGVAHWALAPGGSRLPLGGAMPVELLPQVLAGLALALAVLLAPLFFPASTAAGGAGVPPAGRDARATVPLLREEAGAGPSFLAQALFAALWQAAFLAFALLVVSRLTPLAPTSILQAGVWLALCALAAIFLAHAKNFPRAYPALMFVWVIVLPVCGYFLAELFLSGPAGAKGWSEAAGSARAGAAPQAAVLRTLMHWLLSLSPGTALCGSVTGVLADGSAWSWPAPFVLLCILNAILGWRIVAHKQAEAGANG